MSQDSTNQAELKRDPAEDKLLEAVRELSYGSVEAIVHAGRITEIRQLRKVRLEPVKTPGTTPNL